MELIAKLTAQRGFMAQDAKKKKSSLFPPHILFLNFHSMFKVYIEALTKFK